MRLIHFLVTLLFVLPLGLVQAAEPKSGYEFLDETTQAMQDDDFENPGMITVERGQELFQEHRLDEEHPCTECHGEDGEKLDTKKIASYPIFNPNLGGLVTLQSQINYCWEINMDRFPLEHDHKDLIALETYIRNKAKGEIINVQTDGEMAKLLVKAEALYNTRYGQLDMSCQHCHMQHQGQRLRAQKLSQGQGNGFPLYRLGTGKITTLQQRMRECFISFRADPFDAGSEEYNLLELFVMQKGNGLKIETPAVRF